MFDIKTASAIIAMREGGKILAKIVRELAHFAKAGMTTKALDREAERLMTEYDVIPSFKGYRGFPAVICTSVNEEIVHAIPGERVLMDGDLLKIDCGIIHRGLHTDHAVAVLIGTPSPEVRKFSGHVEQAMYKGIEQVKPGNKIGDIGSAVQHYVESQGYSIVRDFIGHGIGKNLHEPPEIPNYGKKGHGPALIPGMTICIEPIVAMGGRYAKTLPDGWTAVTQDGSFACQFEHTILVTENGHEILTKV